MARTKVTFMDPKTGRNKVGVLNIKTNDVTVRGGKKYPLDTLVGVDHHETMSEGSVIQKVGKFLGLNK